MKKITDKLMRKLMRLNWPSSRKNREAYGKTPDFGPQVTVGKHTYGVNSRTVFSALSENQPPVSIGNFCSIAMGVVILANADHATHLPSLYPFRSTLFAKGDKPGKNSPNLDVVTKGPVEIGHDVWVGTNAIILSGVSIGTGAVIGAGAVVTKSIPPYAIAAGNPARVIRYRFEPEIIEQLLQSEWWLLPDDSIQELEPYFYSDNISQFLDKVRSIKKRT